MRDISDEEIKDNCFKIAGGKRGMKISWRVTGLMQDAYANTQRVAIEEDKPAQERGLYPKPGRLPANLRRRALSAATAAKGYLGSLLQVSRLEGTDRKLLLAPRGVGPESDC